ncbi:glycosyltransferase family 2 protein [Adonisia turfae]|uniref:Glycosyltransferase n=1 Tax=Adonisia turfae CCMR0081 TaxID=2292702 RepID=A0A6M0RU94_9CYAN|nr:glycosyltransferase [Adonisia turfae]NEZ59798.1 glycosyltransferase [Adonisia turfae CCMR0081]
MTAKRFNPNALPQAASKPSITIVVSPRECFGSTQQTLESIYRHTKMPFELVYVDTGSPKQIKNYLSQAAVKYNFTLLRSEHFLTPNQARNLGLSQVTTDYIVFITNDIHVSNGWLERLWQCSQETDAAVVCPLTCVGIPLHERIHLAGGEARVFMDVQDGQPRRCLYEQPFLVGCSATAMKSQLSRRACEFAELNCLLIKREIFAQIGYLDPRLVGAQADMDFCLNVNRVGGLMFCEPASVVTHVSQKPNNWADWSCFMLRWSDAWGLESLMRFQQKWDLDVERYFQTRYSHLGQHRQETVVYPLLRQLTIGNISPWLEQLTIDVERWFNQTLADRYAQSSEEAVGKVVHAAVGSTQTMESRTRALVSISL